ncbi:MAG: hypothetical protein DLM68_07925 [Hyphomicrobiales bacterium]|nr:MAG: hypothetical protein DLM68_07925 [Hyphomicrobiales bacterium]
MILLSFSANRGTNRDNDFNGLRALCKPIHAAFEMRADARPGWPLQRICFLDRARKPRAPLFPALVKSTGMALAWIGRTPSFDSAVRNAKELMLAGLSLPLAGPKPPNPREGEERPAFVARGPMRHV